MTGEKQRGLTLQESRDWIELRSRLAMTLLACISATAINVSSVGAEDQPNPPAAPATKVSSTVPQAPDEEQQIPLGPMHRVQLRISGSSCLACLHELEKKVRNVPGIAKCKKIGRAHV